MKLKRLMIAVCVLACCGCSQLDYVGRQTGEQMVRLPRVRVAILKSEGVRLRCDGTYRLYCFHDSHDAKGFFTMTELQVANRSKRLVLSELSGFVLDSSITRMIVAPMRSGQRLRVNGKSFRGILELRSGDTALQVINTLNVEDYLQGVLPPEIGKLTKHEYEAYKAQAVAARTYALTRVKSAVEDAYDLVSSIQDQVYTGLTAETRLSNKAVRATHGEVLTYHGELISAHYHSTCGGRTEDVNHVWDRADNGYLKGVDDNDYCKWSKYYSWQLSWTPAQLAQFLVDYLSANRNLVISAPTLQDIRIVERYPSGRIGQLALVTDQGEFLLFKDQIRWALRRPQPPFGILPSTNFDLDLARDSAGQLVGIVASGKGFGHGVGMCQTGAIGRARLGQKYDEILQTYYSGVQISKVY